jgi:hypothetical protein
MVCRSPDTPIWATHAVDPLFRFIHLPLSPKKRLKVPKTYESKSVED